MREYPTRPEAERLLQESEQMNPGPWGDHCRVVAKCAEAIAKACGDLDSEKAYVLGLMHDIGRRFGYGHLKHVYNGWRFMLELGYPAAAKICLTHSCCIPTLEVYIGRADIAPEQYQELAKALSATEYDEYDQLIQLCDAIGMADGATDILTRMNDVKSRYGQYPQAKWDKNLELKDWFSEKAGRPIEEITAGIRP